MLYNLPSLAYAYDSLEPYIDARTMEIHYTKHHQNYVSKLNEVLSKYPDLTVRSLKQLMTVLDNLPLTEPVRKALRNNGGGHLNHSLFWQVMGPEKQVDEQLTEEIIRTFGSISEFKAVFSQTALARFGSGWAWLVKDKTGKLLVYNTANQDSPYLRGHQPIFCLDVWEHAYYLKYQNRRSEYIENWWSVLKLIN